MYKSFMSFLGWKKVLSHAHMAMVLFTLVTAVFTVHPKHLSGIVYGENMNSKPVLGLFDAAP